MNTEKLPPLVKVAATGGLLLAACAACCAPLVAGPVVALIAAGGAGLALAGQVTLAALFVGAGWLYVWQRRRARQKALAASCACAPGAGCNKGDACDLPATDRTAAAPTRAKSVC